VTTPVPLDTTAITSVLLGDGEWHAIDPGTPVTLFNNPQFADPFGGPPVSVGGQWVWFVSAGVAYSCDITKVAGVQWNPPAPQAQAQAEVAAAGAAATDGGGGS
jgi:hypothetical protein